ncbi:MAG: MarR family winged helix-turn-helix transcriptional regulator [Emergencia sp.]
MEQMANAFLIKKIHDGLEKHANNTLRSKELTMMQVAVLMSLRESESGQLSMKEIEREFHVAQSTVAGIVSRLEQKGLVEAYTDSRDKRVKLVHITSSGELCCRETEVHMREGEELLNKGLTEEEKEKLHELLLKAAENVK